MILAQLWAHQSPTTEGALLSMGSLPGAAPFRVLQPGRCEAAFQGLKDELMSLQRAGPQHMSSSLGQPGLQGSSHHRLGSWGRGTSLTNGQWTGIPCHPKSSPGDPSWHNTFGEQFALLSPPSGHPYICTREAWQRHELRSCHGKHLPLGPAFAHLPDGTNR